MLSLTLQHSFLQAQAQRFRRGDQERDLGGRHPHVRALNLGEKAESRGQRAEAWGQVDPGEGTHVFAYLVILEIVAHENNATFIPDEMIDDHFC
jgi:hypothetical protein